MNTKELITRLTQDKKVKDYSYAILFFAISSFFAWFVIKPVLGIAFSLDRQKKDLVTVDAVYERNLNELIDTQSKLELIRDRVELLDQALPAGPHTQTVLLSIQNAASKTGVSMSKVSIARINLKTNGKVPETFSVNTQIDGSFGQAQAFVRELLNQRRIKTIKNLHMVSINATAESASAVRLDIVVDVAYL